jgi:hypothetical protein
MTASTAAQGCTRPPPEEARGNMAEPKKKCGGKTATGACDGVATVKTKSG